MLETRNLKEGRKSQKQTIKKKKNKIKYPERCALELPSFKSPVVHPSPCFIVAPTLPPSFRAPGVWGLLSSFSPKA